MSISLLLSPYRNYSTRYEDAQDGDWDFGTVRVPNSISVNNASNGHHETNGHGSNGHHDSNGSNGSNGIKKNGINGKRSGSANDVSPSRFSCLFRPPVQAASVRN